MITGHVTLNDEPGGRRKVAQIDLGRTLGLPEDDISLTSIGPTIVPSWRADNYIGKAIAIDVARTAHASAGLITRSTVDQEPVACVEGAQINRAKAGFFSKQDICLA